jgi:uncharacterized protein DUF3467
MMEQQKDYPPEIKPLEGKYANYFRVGHTEDVFVFDYYQIFPENDDDESNIRLFNNPKFRIIISPSDSRQLLKQLRTAIEKYEADKKKSKKLRAKTHNNSDN